MHIAIDDTYGPVNAAATTYVTGARRTYVGVEFEDSQVEDIRENVRACLEELRPRLGSGLAEFHFADIYNCTGQWTNHRGLNLEIFEFFAERYSEHRWRVHVQTVDEGTLRDRESEFVGKANELDLTNREDQALFMLLRKLKFAHASRSEPLVLRADAGRSKAGSLLVPSLFRDWGDAYDGRYAESRDEPLIQIADFLAYSINRCTHLLMKQNRSEHDERFLALIGGMGIRSDDVKLARFAHKPSAADIDAVYAEDRRKKGIK